MARSPVTADQNRSPSRGSAPWFLAWQGQCSALGALKTGSILLQLVPERKTALKKRQW